MFNLQALQKRHHVSKTSVTVMSHERHGVSHIWQLDCLFNSLILTTKKVSKLCIIITGPGNSLVTVIFPHRGPMMQKVFPCHNVIFRFIEKVVSNNLSPKQNDSEIIIHPNSMINC